MNVSELRNPYDYANPVQEGNLFAGRGTELSRIAYVLDQAGIDRPVRYVALHGQRASGKTSLLNMIEMLARERGYLTVRVDVVPGDAAPVGFFGKLYEELIGAVSEAVELASSDGRKITPRMIRRLVNGTAPDDDFPLEFPESLAHAHAGGRMSEMALRADLEYLLERVGRPIVLVVDEAQLIADNQDVLSMLRTMGMQLRGYVLVLAGTGDLLTRINEVFDHLLRQFELVKVERFTEIADVHSCMSLPLASLGLHAEQCFARFSETVSDLMSLTDGNPYEIQFFCHVMFNRWQTGAATELVLSPEAVDDVRAVLELRGEIRERPLVTAVRRMSAEQLVALNVLCSCLERATLEEIWFAHCLATTAPLTWEQLNRHLDEFVEAGIVERDNDTVRLPGDRFEHIYARLWTRKQLGQPHHPQFISRMSLRHLLSRNLEYRLCDSLRGEPARQLTTCCFGMDARHLERGLAALETLPFDRKISFTVRFLHEAIVRCGIPGALDLTTVTCSYCGTNAVRWIYTADSDDFELSAHPAFIQAREKVTALGGELHAERTRLPLKPWPEILEWLIATAPVKARLDMAAHHVTASFNTYKGGDLAGTIDHLSTAFRLAPSWTAANNLAYVSLKAGRAADARYWADKALPLAENPVEKALSRYNGAMALLRDGDLGAARKQFAAAAEHLAPLATTEYPFEYLLIPQIGEDAITFREEAGADLASAISTATELADLAERYARLRDSAG